MNTAGQIITNCGRYYVNQSEGMQTKSPLLRSRLRFFLREVMARAWTVAPLPQRDGSGTVSIDTTGKGSFPTDFSVEGTATTVFLLTGGTTPLVYMPRQQLLANLTQWPDQGQPTNWTRIRNTAAGLAQMQVWPPPQVTSSVKVNGYDRRCLDPIDFPGVPTAASGAAGLLTGAYKWKATYEWADGTTEGGFESAALTVAAKQVTVTVPISESRYVTGVTLFRTANGGLIFKEAGSGIDVSGATIVTVGGVQCVQFTDNTADSDLGANAPIPSEAVTGVEQFPDDFIETLLTEGLVARAMTSQGDLRDAGFWAAFLKECRRAWAENKPGRSQGRQLIAYGQRRDAGSPLDIRYRYNG